MGLFSKKKMNNLKILMKIILLMNSKEETIKK